MFGQVETVKNGLQLSNKLGNLRELPYFLGMLFSVKDDF